MTLNRPDSGSRQSAQDHKPALLIVEDMSSVAKVLRRTFEKAGLKYYGYDVDKRLVSYAKLLHRSGEFTTEIEVLQKESPFELIVANCCFHHIEDEMLSGELSRIKNLLADDGTFIMIDLLKAENDNSILRGLFRKMEKGGGK